MSPQSYDYLDGNAAASELSKIFAMDVTAARDSVRTAAQPSALPRRICTCKVPA
jgi:hypothetical protein